MSGVVAPYGSWASPVSVELMTSAAIGLSSLSVDGDALYWLESRPAENGRSVLCRRGADGGVEDVTPPPFNVGSRVHEYGGGAYAAHDGAVIFSERKDGSVWLIDKPGAAPRRIATSENCRYADFEWDPRRHRALAIREDHRDRPPNDPKAAIVALGSNPGETETVLLEGPDFLSSPRLSPDGATLAWIAWDHPAMPWDATRLFKAKVAQTGDIGPPQIIAGGEPEAIVQPAWSPGNILHFCSDRTGWWNLYAVRNDEIVALAPVEAEIGGPHWIFRQRFYAFLPDGRIIASMVRDAIRRAALIFEGAIRPLDIGQIQECPTPVEKGIAYLATPPDQPPALVLASDIGGGETIIVRNAAPAPVPPDTVSIGEPFDFETPGGTAHAFWYPPRNGGFLAPPGESPPLIVLSHGGPTSMTTNSFNLNIQWWTSRGFGVVDVNYGGSTGFGRAYRRRLYGQWGLVDVEDCSAAARRLVERGLADGSRLAIRGGSAGGFTTLAALTSSTLFKAGASFYGVADLMLLATDTHKFEARYLDQLIGPLPGSEALYAERSPICHIDRLSCPVIFFQGEDDRTVPPNQAQTMVAAMKARKLAVAYYEFAGEGHGFRQAETLRRTLELELDFYGQIFGFSPPGLSERAMIDNGKP
ncbi:S9 family peptidase [Methylocapsa palsarum]|uniref:Dipeptidyl aminopeptidase/acylaminoacyl peptidase n=1 Tax=Methylocapsa palsarum TaxID=1612308 RepID=A0A1I3Z3Q4_9HYPH|nr:prolyl oligopeptidase family serine peptidase [Methylocapsa palsarum]SFK38640.1 Dipeptidyl aminopeptidase/acylaminoacyl peptidase [Methylocapsa palsarum]